MGEFDDKDDSFIEIGLNENWFTFNSLLTNESQFKHVPSSLELPTSSREKDNCVSELFFLFSVKTVCKFSSHNVESDFDGLNDG